VLIISLPNLITLILFCPFHQSTYKPVRHHQQNTGVKQPHILCRLYSGVFQLTNGPGRGSLKGPVDCRLQQLRFRFLRYRNTNKTCCCDRQLTVPGHRSPPGISFCIKHFSMVGPVFQIICGYTGYIRDVVSGLAGCGIRVMGTII